MVKAKRIGHATFETADLERQTDYYTDVLGLFVAEREKDRVFLATKIGQLAIQLNKGERERCTKLSFEVAPNSDFGELARELAKDGIKSEPRNDSLPGIGSVLAFEDCKGSTIELFKDWSYLGKHTPVRRTRWAPSPRPNSGLPEFGTINWSKSETSDFDWGEGWGEGV